MKSAKIRDSDKIRILKTIEKLPYSQVTRNELLARLLSEINLDDDVGSQVNRRHFLEG